jgi:hypothetical protein
VVPKPLEQPPPLPALDELPLEELAALPEPPEDDEQLLAGSHCRELVEPPASAMQAAVQFAGRHAAGQLVTHWHAPQVPIPLLLQYAPASRPLAQGG